MEILLKDISVIDLKANQVLVINIKESITIRDLNRIKNELNSIFPANKVIIHTDQIEITAINPQTKTEL